MNKNKPKQVYNTIRKIIEETTREPINIKPDTLDQVKFNRTVDSSDRNLSPTSVAFDVFIESDSYSSIPIISFDIVSTDDMGVPVTPLLYKIYRDTADENGIREENPVLIAEVRASDISGENYRFRDSGYAESRAFYTVTCVDSKGVESYISRWDEYYDIGAIPNDVEFDSYEVLEDKSINVNYTITYTDGVPNEYERNKFLLNLSNLDLRRGTDWESGIQFDSSNKFTYNLKPNSLTDTIWVKALSRRDKFSENADSLDLSTISYSIGSIDTELTNLSEDFNVNSDGTTTSRIKITLKGIEGDLPNSVLVKLKKSSDFDYHTVFDGVIAFNASNESYIYLEQGIAFNYDLVNGTEYDIAIYIKTYWGLQNSIPDWTGSIDVKGNTNPPSRVYFVDSAGTEINSKIFEKEFILDWAYSIDADDDTYELRYGSTSDTWESATFLWKGRANKYIFSDAEIYTGGTLRFFLKSRNRSGVEQDIADYIDCSNNVPSQPNAPAIESTNSGILFSWIEKTTNSDKDINYYLLDIYEEGTLLKTVKVYGDSFTFNGTSGKTYKARIKAFDIYNQESVYSSFSGEFVFSLTMNDGIIYLYPTGSYTTDSNNLNTAISNLNSGFGGKIFLVGETYYWDGNIVSFNASNPVTLKCDLGRATVYIQNHTSFSINGDFGVGSVENIDFYASSGDLGTTKILNNFQTVKNCNFDKGAVNNITYVLDCSGLQAIYCKTAIGTDSIYISASKLCENCTFSTLFQGQNISSGLYVGNAKCLNCKLELSNLINSTVIEQYSNCIIDGLVIDVTNMSSGNFEIKQRANSQIINSNIRIGIFDDSTGTWTSTQLTITQWAFSSIVNCNIVGNIIQPVSYTRGFSPSPFIDPSDYLECSSKISNTIVEKGNIEQGEPDPLYPTLKFECFMSNSKIIDTAETWGSYYYSNNNIGTEIHN